MSTTINSIEINSITCKKLRTIIHKQTIEHLEEVPFGDFKLDLVLCDEVYDYSEQVGHCRAYVALVDGNYAGYMVVMASEMLHHRGVIQAVTDSFYIIKEQRHTGLFMKLLAHIEGDLKANNIRFLTVGLNPNMPHYSKMDNMLSKLGYLTTEVSVTKEL